MKKSTSWRRSRQARSCVPDLFDWAQQQEQLEHPAVRVISRRIGVSPAVALVYAELSGLSREARGD